MSRGPRACVATVCVLVGVTIIAGCSADEPRELPVPEVIWSDGAPSGELESSSWVAKVRAAETLSSVAWNNLDYSDPDLVAAWGYGTVTDLLVPSAELRLDNLRAEIAVVPDMPRLVDAGPLPMTPIAVEETPEGATVTTCVAAAWNSAGDVTSASIVIYEVTENGRRAITKSTADLDVQNADPDRCTVDMLPHARFDPAPTPPTDPEVTITPPADREAYGLDSTES